MEKKEEFGVPWLRKRVPVGTWVKGGRRGPEYYSIFEKIITIYCNNNNIYFMLVLLFN